MLNKKSQKRTALIITMLAAWFLLVLYPNPGRLAASIYRMKNPPVTPLLVSDIAEQIESSSPSEIKAYVYSELPYRFDWEVYNMPWYSPTLEEALEKGSGDCKARFLLFASLLEEKNIPYQKKVSLTHIWVSYDGKPENALENDREAVFIVDENGRLILSMPRPDLQRSWRSFYRGFWEVMPGARKALLLAGFPFVFGFIYLPGMQVEAPYKFFTLKVLSRP